MNYYPTTRAKVRPRMQAPKPEAPVNCPGHDKWVRGRVCCALGLMALSPLRKEMGRHECQGRMEAHHETTRGAGGGDDKLIPFCSLAHDQHHRGYVFVGLDQAEVAATCWRASPHRIPYERKQAELASLPSPSNP